MSRGKGGERRVGKVGGLRGKEGGGGGGGELLVHEALL